MLESHQCCQRPRFALACSDAKSFHVAMEPAHPFSGMRAYRQGGIAAEFMKPHTDCEGQDEDAASYLYK